MTQFNLGDKVRRVSVSSSKDVKPGTEWTVADLPSEGWICLEGTAGKYLARGFELVEPAAIESVTAFLDETDLRDAAVEQVDWWNIAPDFGQTYSDILHAAVTCGLDIRVQVRRIT